MGDRVSLHSIRRGKMEGSQSRCLIATRQEHLLRRNANNLQLSVSKTQSPSSAVANSFSITPVARSAPLYPHLRSCVLFAHCPGQARHGCSPGGKA